MPRFSKIEIVFDQEVKEVEKSRKNGDFDAILLLLKPNIDLQELALSVSTGIFSPQILIFLPNFYPKNCVR